MLPEFDTCYRAVHSRDARFDGWFYTAVRSTGIYCRPSCPATTPLARNVTFLPSAAAAQQAGYRACRRCRPDASPGSPEWQVRGDLAGRAMRLIGDGEVDRGGVEGLAARLGYSTRQLNRTLRAELGAGPLALARAQRAQAARVLLETTELSATEVAFAAGFASVRQFNDTIREVFDTRPTGLRAAVRAARPSRGTGALTVRLAFRPPMAYSRTVAFLAAGAVPGLESVAGDSYTTVLALPRGAGLATVSPVAGATYLSCRLRLHDIRDIGVATARIRRLFDLDADPAAVDAALPADLVTRWPGLRSPGAVDGYELAVRTIVGQQVSTAGARTVLGRITAQYGRTAFDGEPWRLFPEPAVLAQASDLPLPARRSATIRALSRAVAEGTLSLDTGADRAATRACLLALPGIGPWTADYALMRALGDPDVFLDSDLAVRRAGFHDQARYAPWRSYLTHHIWTNYLWERR